MKQPCEGVTGRVIMQESRDVMEHVYRNVEKHLARSGRSRANLWLWMKDHGITYSERSFADWSATTKNKRLESASTLVIAALATGCNIPVQTLMFGEI